MPATFSPRIKAILFRVVTICAIATLFASLRSAKVDIGTPATAVQSRSVAARTAETIRYQDSNLDLIAVYRVTDGQLESTATPEHRRIWDLAVATLPAEAIAHIHQLNLVTDGPARTLAMVHRSTTEHDAWILSIDPAESHDVLEHTLVHELAHIYTLDEADLSSQRTNCTGRLLEIGCAHAGSLLAEYADQFWNGLPEPAPYSESAFVTQYAAESAHEDLAETFMFWVYGDKPASSAIAAKYHWFDTIDTFVTARNEIRANLQRA
jgi:hypothetical protein